ncbi:hypothetical protein D5X79_25615, partial [Salmonella enterica subsp. enterica]|nr:hypothetical protein [Salmonella enterica subsp. enterica]
LFGADRFRAALLGTMGIAAEAFDYKAGVDAALDSIAAELETVLDVDALLACAALRGSTSSP